MGIIGALSRRLPRPVAKMVGKVVVRVSPGIRSVHEQVAAYAAAWDESNVNVLAGMAVTDDPLGGATTASHRGPLWVVLGDSTAQGIGAHGHQHGYVGQVRAALEARDGRPWRVLNLSKSGARVDHVIDVQLPRLDDLDDLGVEPDLVTCAIGANDLVRRTPPDVLRARLDEIIGRLPAESVIATLPQGLRPELAVGLNDSIRTAAANARLRVADVFTHTTGPWKGRVAADGFHPNAHGYAAWAAAFAEAIGVELTR